MAIAYVISAITVLISPCNQEHSIWRRGIIGYLIRGLEHCGIYCYGIYVWHAVLLVLNNLFWNITPGPACMGLALLAVPMSFLSYMLIEKPMLRFKFPRNYYVLSAK